MIKNYKRLGELEAITGNLTTSEQIELDALRMQDIEFADLRKGANSYGLGFWITEGGNVTVQADSKEEAIAKLNDYLNTYSKDQALDEAYSCTNREWEVLDFADDEA